MIQMWLEFLKVYLQSCLLLIETVVGKCYYNTMRKQEERQAWILRNYYVRASKYISMFTA